MGNVDCVFMVAILPWQTVAETPSSAPSHITEESAGIFEERGTVTLISNLRSSPSMHSEIVAVAKGGARVLIFQESGRWLQVRDEEGVEAWIYKPLVLVEQELARSPSGTHKAMKAVRPHKHCLGSGRHPRCSRRISKGAPAFPDVPVESPAGTSLEGPELRRSFVRSDRRCPTSCLE